MGKCILIVEDDPDILEILKIIFESEGYEVILSITGDEISVIDLIAPDVVLMDISLSKSKKNGNILCAELKSNPKTSLLPILLLSAEADIKNIAKACGADGYISKPFDIYLLVLKVMLLCESN